MTARGATYILPIRRAHAPADDELTTYLRWVAARMAVTIVDGSPPPVFAAHAAAWGTFATHIPVDRDIVVANGKVAGVLTALRQPGAEALVIADDDVRYDEASLTAVVRLLESAHVVRPQNYFEPVPWHALWDTGRILVNRALDGDWPGTLGVRRSALASTGGYSGDVLFENLELVRTVVAAGGRECLARDVLVRRVPPPSGHFWSQRVRQAYDELARPGRLVAQLAIAPTVVLIALRFGGAPLLGAALAIGAFAELGRRRDGGRRVFDPRASAMAPIWVLERGVTAWLAVGLRVFRGGVPYAGRRLARAGTSARDLRRRHGGRIAGTDDAPRPSSLNDGPVTIG